MKKLFLVLLGASFVYCMEEVAAKAVQRYRERARDRYFNEVPQAKTAQGFEQAYDYYYELSDQELVPGIPCVLAHVFYEEHGSQYPEVAQMIVRFHNCVIERAFSMSQKGKEVEQALKAVVSNPHDCSYIITGHRNGTLDVNEFKKKTAEIAELIQRYKPYFGMIDE